MAGTLPRFAQALGDGRPALRTGDQQRGRGRVGERGAAVDHGHAVERCRGRSRCRVEDVRAAHAVDDAPAFVAARGDDGFAALIAEAGEHTLTVINQATPGRPRIDLDSFVLSR